VKRFFSIAVLVASTFAMPAWANDPTVINIQYITREFTAPPTLSNLDPVETDVGLQGVQLGVADSNTTGRFLGQEFVLTEISIPETADIEQSIAEAGGAEGLIVANLSSADLLALSDSVDDTETLIFNAGAADNILRNSECRGNVMHTLPSWSMLTDALTQFMLRKRWTELLLLVGTTDADKQFGEALKKSATKFGTKIVDELGWDGEVDLRRNAYEDNRMVSRGRAMGSCSASKSIRQASQPSNACGRLCCMGSRKIYCGSCGSYERDRTSKDAGVSLIRQNAACRIQRTQDELPRLEWTAPTTYPVGTHPRIGRTCAD